MNRDFLIASSAKIGASTSGASYTSIVVSTENLRNLNEQELSTKSAAYIEHLLFILNITLADIRVYIESSLGIDGDAFSRLLDRLSVQIRIYNILLLVQFAQNLGVRVHDHAVAPGVVVGSHVSSR